MSNPKKFSYKVEVMTTFLKEMLELSNLVTWPHLQYNLGHMMKFLVTSWTKIIAPKPLFQNTYISTKFKVANFADIIRIAIMLIKSVFVWQNDTNIFSLSL